MKIPSSVKNFFSFNSHVNPQTKSNVEQVQTRRYTSLFKSSFTLSSGSIRRFDITNAKPQNPVTKKEFKAAKNYCEKKLGHTKGEAIGLVENAKKNSNTVIDFIENINRITSNAKLETKKVAAILDDARKFCMGELCYDKHNSDNLVVKYWGDATGNLEEFTKMINNIPINEDQQVVEKIPKKEVKKAKEYCIKTLKYDKKEASKLVAFFQEKSTNIEEFKKNIKKIITNQSYQQAFDYLKRSNYDANQIKNIMFSILDNMNSDHSFSGVLLTDSPVFQFIHLNYGSNAEKDEYINRCSKALVDFGYNKSDAPSLAAKIQKSCTKEAFRTFILNIERNDKFHDVMRVICKHDTTCKIAFEHFKNLGYSENKAMDFVFKAMKSAEFDDYVDSVISLKQVQHGYDSIEEIKKCNDDCFAALKESGVSAAIAKDLAKKAQHTFSKNKLLKVIKNIRKDIYNVSEIIIKTNSKFKEAYDNLINLNYPKKYAVFFILEIIINNPDKLHNYTSLLPTKSEMDKGYYTNDEVLENFYWGKDYINSLGYSTEEATEIASYLHSNTASKSNFIASISIIMLKNDIQQTRAGFITEEKWLASLLGDSARLMQTIEEYEQQNISSVAILTKEKALEILQLTGETTVEDIEKNYQKLLIKYIKKHESMEDRLQLVKSYLLAKEFFRETQL